MNDTSDVRYDTAAMRAYATNLLEVWRTLRDGGMDRREALEIIRELVRSLAAMNSANS